MFLNSIKHGMRKALIIFCRSIRCSDQCHIYVIGKFAKESRQMAHATTLTDNFSHAAFVNEA
jgi:phosphoribosylaminoimidazole carboxylase (NCAIR synthetase)